MASDSHTTMFPAWSTGTLPTGDTACIRAGEPSSYSGMTVSSKGMPATLAASHGRSDHDEYALLPMYRWRGATICHR